MPEVRIGLVGCGRLAESGYAPAADLATGVRIGAVADPDPVRRGTLASATSAPAYADLGSMLDAGALDGVIVASPPASHVEHATAVARRGVACLVEKPPAPDYAGALELARLVPAPWVGFNRRYSLGAGLDSVLPDGGGRIGVELRYRRASWAPVQVRDPALTDLAPHAVDLATRAGLGTPSTVSASNEGHDRVCLELAGKDTSAVLECATDRPHLERIAIADADGKVVAKRGGGGLARGVVARLRPGPHPLVASLVSQLEDFAAAIRGSEPRSLATAGEGAAVMAVIAAAAESLAHGGDPVGIDATTAGVR